MAGCSRVSGRATPGPQSAPGDAHSRGKAPPHFLGTVGPAALGEHSSPRLLCAVSDPKVPEAWCRGWGPLYVGGGAGQDVDRVSARSVCLCACLCVHECVLVCAYTRVRTVVDA